LIDHASVIGRVADVLNRRDLNGFEETVTDDYVEDYPQSGELIRGPRNARLVRENYPGREAGDVPVDVRTASIAASRPRWIRTPLFTLVQVEGSGKTGVATFRSLYPDGSWWWVVNIYELRGDRISRARMFFAPAFEPPDWRAPYREPLGTSPEAARMVRASASADGTETSLSPAEHRAIFERMADALNRASFDELDDMFTEDVVEVYPQSGEVIRGLAHFRATFKNYPGGLAEANIDVDTAHVETTDARWLGAPALALVDVDASGDVGTVTFRTRYPDHSIWWNVILYQLEDRRISHLTIFFAPGFEAPEWRRPYVERVGTDTER
jgi:hypothetical protein